MDLFEKLRKTVESLGESIKDQAGNVGSAARDKSMKMIEEWLQIIPRLQLYGLEISSFSVNFAISPSMDIEMVADAKDFHPEKVRHLLKENKEVKWLAFVLRAVVMAFELNGKLERKEDYDMVILKIRVKVPPEVRVVLGKPVLY